MDTVTTVTTVEGESPALAGDSPTELPAIAYIGMGVAMVSMGRTFLELGIKKAGGWKGVRNMLTRANEILPQLEAGEQNADRVE